MIVAAFDWCRAAGRPSQARMHRWRRMASRIVSTHGRLRGDSNDLLLQRSRTVQWQARAGTPLDDLLIDAYALVREASRRAIGLEHHVVQLVAGIALFEGFVVEMQTGEGKTLTATLPAFLRALPGRGCHVLTANDYLAFRDAMKNHKVFELLGVTCACVIPEHEDDERREAYAQDVTYGTVRELGFDFLRDRLRAGARGHEDGERQYEAVTQAERPVQRGHEFALVDEADSVLIDEARTPLVIGMAQPVDPVTLARVRWCQRAAAQLQPDVHFEYDPNRRHAVLRGEGCRQILLTARSSLLDAVPHEEIYRGIERALVAQYGFQSGRDYLLVDGEVVIVDESTGRTMEGRKWQEGLHQAIEAKEHLPITVTTGCAARITVQSFFRRYAHLAGMTGTAFPARAELKGTYGLKVAVIPTHRPSIRKVLPPRIFTTLERKWTAVAEEVELLHEAGRAVLVGTPSVTASESLARILERAGVPHQVLNARYHEQESEIVGQAGHAGRVTIATNMAGRGTDIELEPHVREHGGLHVIATEMHSSARIDRQLVGRCARQGDPGQCQFFLSVEDELFRVLQPEVRAKLARDARLEAGSYGELPSRWLKWFVRTQRALEAAHTKQRGTLLKIELQQKETCDRLGLDPWLELVE